MLDTVKYTFAKYNYFSFWWSEMGSSKLISKFILLHLANNPIKTSKSPGGKKDLRRKYIF